MEHGLGIHSRCSVCLPRFCHTDCVANLLRSRTHQGEARDSRSRRRLICDFDRTSEGKQDSSEDAYHCVRTKAPPPPVVLPPRIHPHQSKCLSTTTTRTRHGCQRRGYDRHGSYLLIFAAVAVAGLGLSLRRLQSGDLGLLMEAGRYRVVPSRLL